MPPARTAAITKAVSSLCRPVNHLREKDTGAVWLRVAIGEPHECTEVPEIITCPEFELIQPNLKLWTPKSVVFGDIPGLFHTHVRTAQERNKRAYETTS